LTRTFVCGPLTDARAWCKANGVKPLARTTYLLSPLGPGARGVSFEPGDRVVFVGVGDESRLWSSLAPCGLGSVVQPERY
jgi:hypothetical protein